MYRYKHLPKAIENAAKLGFKNGAALYPMVTMNGEECHNEWEITFEEIHRNGAIAYAIFNYCRYTGDRTYLYDYGLEVLIGISRFWYQRVNWSNEKNKYVMLGVTGPNEYENNVNNNWYTNLLAQWCLQYTIESLNALKKIDIVKFKILIEKTSLNETLETDKWKDVIANIYLPVHQNLGIFLQQDGYMDKEQILVKDLPAENKPLNQKWSWDRILRSCFIKQADVLQGIYFFESNFTKEEIKRNFDFYEPRTVHESSLSPCIHAIIAAYIGDTEKAYEMYLRTARLDLNDINNDTEDGCHTTSMAGTWMSLVEGFGGMRVKDDKLHFNPMLPAQWQSFSFKVRFRQHIIQLTINKNQIILDNITGENISVFIQNKLVTLKQDDSTILNLKRKILE
jgi:maltose phosphorylase